MNIKEFVVNTVGRALLKFHETHPQKVFVAEYNVTTAQEIIAYFDAAKEPFAPMLVKRGADYYTVITANKMNDARIIIRTFATLSGVFYIFIYDITDETWANNNYGVQRVLVSGTSIKTVNGESLLGSGNITAYDDTELRDRIAALEAKLA